MEQKITSWIAFFIIFIIIVPAAVVCYFKWKGTIQEIEQLSNLEYNIPRK